MQHSFAILFRMVKFKRIAIECPLQELKTTADEIAAVEPRILRHILFHIYLIREVEIRLLELKDQDQVHGPVHSSIGQEGTAVGAMQALLASDRITSTHRGHHHFLAKAYNAYAGNDYDPLENIPDEIPEVTEKSIAEICGLAQGYCRGRGGSMHLGDRFSGCLGTNAIVAGGVPCAAGVAWAFRMNSDKSLAVALMGDGAVNQGSVFESMNMASLWDIPVVFFIENNLYAVATHVTESSAVEILAQKGIGSGISSLVVDGMDPIAVLRAMEYAKDYCIKDGNGPLVIEAKNYRFKHQAQGLPGSAFGYRTKEEEAQWEKRDPFRAFPKSLLKHGVITKEQDNYLRQKTTEIVDTAIRHLTDSGGKIRLDLFPAEDDLFVGVRSDGNEFDSIKFAEGAEFQNLSERKFIDIIPEVIKKRMDEDESIVILGEEVGKMKGGVFQATRGIFKAHPDRVINTPISENGFTGMSLGLAITGKRPIVELMYPDFTLVAADQIFNQIGKWRYMYGNQFDIPIVFRTKMAMGTGYGAQHSLDPAPLYNLFPGWRVVAPSNPADYIGLFNSALKCNDPVFIIEHAFLYEESGPVPDDRDYFIELGKARVAREGSDITIVSYSFMTSKAIRAAKALEENGISAEIIDLRTVDYANIDYDTIASSVKKTGRVLICEEGLYCGGVGGHISHEIQSRFFDFLDGEIGRVAGVPIPVPVSRIQEARAIPSVDDVIAAVESMLP